MRHDARALAGEPLIACMACDALAAAPSLTGHPPCPRAGRHILKSAKHFPSVKKLSIIRVSLGPAPLTAGPQGHVVRGPAATRPHPAVLTGRASPLVAAGDQGGVPRQQGRCACTVVWGGGACWPARATAPEPHMHLLRNPGRALRVKPSADPDRARGHCQVPDAGRAWAFGPAGLCCCRPQQQPQHRPQGSHILSPHHHLGMGGGEGASRSMRGCMSERRGFDG